MQVGAIGVGAYQPYIYNTNSISRASMNKVGRIGDDLLASKTDFSALTDEQQNVNPLKRGETRGFDEIMSMQMQMSQMNASRIMQTSESPEAASQTETMQPVTQAADTLYSRDMEQFTQAANLGMGATLDFFA